MRYVLLAFLLFSSFPAARADAPKFQEWLGGWTLSEGDPRSCGAVLQVSHTQPERRREQLNFEIPGANGLRPHFTFPNINSHWLWRRMDWISQWVVRSRLEDATLRRTSRGCYGLVWFLSFCEPWIKDYTARLEGNGRLHVTIAEASPAPIQCEYVKGE